MSSPSRRVSRPVAVDGVVVGGGAPIVVQSMTNTDTADVDSTVRQVAALARAGSELVRITVDRNEAAAASSRSTVMRTISEPARASAATCATVPAMSAVSVLVIDCTTTGASPPSSTLPTRTWRVARRGAGPKVQSASVRISVESWAWGETTEEFIWLL